jgi:hypothetical protein
MGGQAVERLFKFLMGCNVVKYQIFVYIYIFSGYDSVRKNYEQIYQDLSKS